jgi:hypothetical protein
MLLVEQTLMMCLYRVLVAAFQRVATLAMESAAGGLQRP